MKKLYYLIVLALILGLALAGCTFLSNIGQAPATDQSGITNLTKALPLTSLVGLWHFDDNALDSSVNSNDGDVHGATYVDGKFGKALSFNGVDDYVDCGNDSSLDLSTLTIEAWIKPVVMKLTYILSKAGSANNKNYFILLYADGRIRGDVLDTTGTSQASAITSAGEITANSWYHIAYTYDGYVGKFYINGVLKATSEIWSGTVGTATIPFYIGQRLGGYFFDGLIDEVRIWNTALKAEELGQFYDFNGLLSPYAEPPKAFKRGRSIPLKWKYTDLAGIVVDSSLAIPRVRIVPTGGGPPEVTGEPIVVEDPGESGLRYDSTDDMWIFNWQTKEYSETSYEIYITSFQTGQINGPFEIWLK